MKRVMNRMMRRVVLAVVAVAFIVLAIVLFRRLFFSSQPAFVAAVGDSVEWKEKEWERPRHDYPERQKKKWHSDYKPRKVRLFAFDPNVLDSVSLLDLGLRPGQVRAMMNYRRKNGKWRTAEKFLAAPYLSDEQREMLAPYVKIEAMENVREVREIKETAYVKQQKFAEGTVIDLNLADTTQLKCIPGIGAGYARAIMRYRERLGGFIDVAQLGEISGLPADIGKWFNIGNDKVTRLKINELDFKSLLRHPYLNYEQVKEIVNYRRQFGRLKDWSALKLSKNFTQEDFERLEPYSDFGS